MYVFALSVCIVYVCDKKRHLAAQTLHHPSLLKLAALKEWQVPLQFRTSVSAGTAERILMFNTQSPQRGPISSAFLSGVASLSLSLPKGDCKAAGAFLSGVTSLNLNQTNGTHEAKGTVACCTVYCRYCGHVDLCWLLGSRQINKTVINRI